jgi:hypothetical protein
MDNILLIQLLVSLIWGKCMIFTQFLGNDRKISGLCVFFLQVYYHKSNEKQDKSVLFLHTFKVLTGHLSVTLWVRSSTPVSPLCQTPLHSSNLN